MAKKKDNPTPDPSLFQTIAQTEESQKVSRQLSEFHDLKQHEEAPKIPGYMILKPIGRGAYAQVWEAIQLRTRRFVAVKVFIKKGGVHWFFLQREAERLIRLDKHPHIVSLLDADLGGDIPYYVMDLAQEGSLESLLNKRKLAESGLFEVEKVAEWMEQIGQALQYVHNKQMVHCDLKPANVLLDEEGNVRVADFGHSRVLSESGSALGTLFFMAPEQAVVPDLNHPLQPDVRWDIYALGCTAYAMASGHVPHEELAPQLESATELSDRLRLYRQSIDRRAVPDLFESTKGRVDRDLSAIIAKCMKPNPRERYATVAEVLKDLKNRREGKPVSPLAGDFGYWLGKFLTRYRLPAAFAGVALAAALTAWFFIHERQRAQVQDAAFNYVLRGREYLDKDDEASAAAYFAASNKILPSLLARGNAVLHMPPIPASVVSQNGPVVSVILSPNGKKILEAGGSDGARLFTPEGEPLGRALKTGGTATAAAFSPDGAKIALGDADGGAQVFDAETGKTVGAAIQIDKQVNALSFSPDGKLLLLAGADGSARLFDAATGKAQKQVFPQSEPLFTALFSPDGHRVLTAAKDGRAQLWDAGGGNAIDKPFDLHLKGASTSYKPSLFYAEEGHLIVGTGWDGSVWFFDAGNGHPQGRHLYLEGLGAQAVLSPDGKKFATSVIFAGASGEVRVFNLKSRSPLKFTLHTNGKVLALGFSPDGSKIFAGTADHQLLLWDAQTGAPLGKSLWHGSAVTAAAFGPGGKTIITGAQDGLARFWDLSDPGDSKTTLAWKSPGRERLKGLENHAVLSHDGGRLLTYGGKSACLWDAVSGKPEGDPLVVEGPITRALFSPDDSRALLCDMSREARLFTLSDGSSKVLAQAGAARAGDFSADGKWVLTGGDDKNLRLWDADSGAPRGKPLDTGFKIEKAFFSPDAKRVAVLGAGGALKVYGVPPGEKPLLSIGHKVRAAAFSPDSRWVVTAEGSDANLWDVSSGKKVKSFAHGHALSGVLFSPKGDRVASLGSDGTARLWDVATGKPAGNPLQHAGPLQDWAFSPGGQALVLAYQDGGWQVWDAKTGEPIGDETQEGLLIVELGFSPDGKTLRLLDKKGGLKTLDSSWMDPLDADALLLKSKVAGLCEVDAGGTLAPLSTDAWVKDFKQVAGSRNP
ncbi:MAG TPA: protein kinase [bacterium]|nr:protein kinase [bacterium]